MSVGFVTAGLALRAAGVGLTVAGVRFETAGDVGFSDLPPLLGTKVAIAWMGLTAAQVGSRTVRLGFDVDDGVFATFGVALIVAALRFVVRFGIVGSGLNVDDGEFAAIGVALTVAALRFGLGFGTVGLGLDVDDREGFATFGVALTAAALGFAVAGVGLERCWLDDWILCFPFMPAIGTDCDPLLCRTL
jgi:hypothetical protein